MAKAILFDFDGPLVDSLSMTIDFCLRMKEKYQLLNSLPPATEIEAWKKTVGFPMSLMLQNIGFSERQAQQIHNNEYLAEFGEQKNPAPLHRGMKHIIRRLLDDGNRLGIVSLNHRCNILASLGELADSFEVIHSFNEFPEKPPALTDAAERLSTTTEQAIYVGDSLADHHAARAVKMPFFGVSYGWQITGNESEFVSAKTPRELESMLTYF